jgi:hypothetical protein
MDTTTPMTLQTPIAQNTTNQVCCPICGWAMAEQRGQWQCGRCYFKVCEDCEGCEASIGQND